MQSLLRLLLVLVTQLIPAQMLHLPPESNSTGNTVMTFKEVLEKSHCRPMEQLVYVEQEFPEEVEFLYKPACVPLWRCSGCCINEELECHPTLERNVTLQMMRILPPASAQPVELTFVEHQRCECRERQPLQNHKSITESIKNRPRRQKHKKTASDCEKCQSPQNKINPH
ncbi:vascular endothelial growth factor A-like isoform X1 [Acanthochromis polyacanthus]|uniref:Vascular endothelial growth factor A-like n=1 Tax=Acanthochromis polyacanthus TaxID=80966 RepID=A0A3Q1FDE2_9TELE|nr:vascular endothelial growth factor A-like isoform X1 [Acanthochromis polyacanthus]